MHEEYRYSLCVTYQGRGGQNLAYRIADFDPASKMFFEADYTERFTDYVEYQPTIIGANPVELTLEEAGVRRWKPQPDNDRKQISYAYNDVKAYEIIKDRDLIAAKNRDELVEVLCKGITIPPFIQGEFFLIIGDLGKQYEAIVCTKKDFNASGERYSLIYNIDDMLHTTHSFNLYVLEKSDIISNSYLKEVLNTDSVTSLRLFYRFTYLPESTGTFVPRKPEAYLSAYLKWFCKKADYKVEFTRKEVDRLVDLLSVSLESESAIESFFKEAPFSKEEIATTLMKHSETVSSYFINNDSTNNALANVATQNPKLFEKCMRLVKNKWLAETSELREREEEKLKQLKVLQEEHERAIADLEYEENEKKQKINALEEHLAEMQGAVEQAEAQKKNIKNEIAESAERFEKDIVDFMRIEGVFRYNANETVKGSEITYTNASGYIISDILLDNEVEDTEAPEELYDFLDDLTDNISIWFDHAHEIAASVLAVIFQKKAIIVANSYGRELASSVALLMDGKTPFEISVAADMKSVFAAAKAINLREEKNVYVSGVLDTFFEAAIPTLLQLCPNKIFWFGITALDSLNLMSKSIYESAIVINTESDLKLFMESEHLWRAKEDIYKFQPAYESRRLEKVYAYYMAPLHENNYINKVSAILFSKIAAVYFQISGDKILAPVIQKSILARLSDREDIRDMAGDILIKRLDE